MNQSYRPVDGLIARVVDGQMVLVSPTSGIIRVLNEVGTVIWQSLQAGAAPAGASAAVVAAYDVDPDQARHDVELFLDDLSRRQLLQ